jgi:predicted unusual protein kinase regulating ubiquinone biosynthesis (AarF/ABC1/UbiB family)
MKNTSLKTFAPVPKTRTSRLLNLGGLATKVASNVLAEGTKHWIKGDAPPISELVLNTKNLSEVADKLARMRGAAMKLGQLLSMDAGTLLPVELASVLTKLQSEGVMMPKTQLIDTLESEWGADWSERFSYFSFEPIAAASIGQVHRARSNSGDELAVKIQFPGVAESIDSDIDNVLSLLKLSRLLPKTLKIDDLVVEARRQLKLEANYLAEAAHLSEFTNELAKHQVFADVVIPSQQLSLTTNKILTMSFVEGLSLESWLQKKPHEANRLITTQLELFFTELLNMNLMQTDPNPANYQVEPDTGKLTLLDFGAVRRFDKGFVANYKSAIDQAIAQDRPALLGALEELGFFAKGRDVANKDVVLDIFMLAAEPLRATGSYNFGSSNLAKRIQMLGMSVSKNPDAWHTPPADVLFLHRKMAGLYLLAAKHNAQVDVAQLYHSFQ